MDGWMDEGRDGGMDGCMGGLIESINWMDSFIHIEHLYSASSRELLRGAPDFSTAKKSSLKVRKKRR